MSAAIAATSNAIERRAPVQILALVLYLARFIAPYWRLALVAMLVWPLFLLGLRIFAPRRVDASYARKQDEGGAHAIIQENVQSQPIIKALNLQNEAMHVFGLRNAQLAKSVLRVSFLSALVERSAGVGIMLLQVVVLAIGAWVAGSRSCHRPSFRCSDSNSIYCCDKRHSCAIAWSRCIPKDFRQRTSREQGGAFLR